MEISDIEKVLSNAKRIISNAEEMIVDYNICKNANSKAYLAAAISKLISPLKVELETAK